MMVIKITKYNAAQFYDSVSNKTSFIGSSLSTLNQPVLFDTTCYGTLNMTGTPNFNASGNNSNCLVLNSVFSLKLSKIEINLKWRELFFF